MKDFEINKLKVKFFEGGFWIGFFIGIIVALVITTFFARMAG